MTAVLKAAICATLFLGDDGALAVNHAIDVHPHGDEIRRGVFFELPE